MLDRITTQGNRWLIDLDTRGLWLVTPWWTIAYWTPPIRGGWRPLMVRERMHWWGHVKGQAPHPEAWPVKPNLAELMAELGVDMPAPPLKHIEIQQPRRPPQPTISLVEAYEAALETPVGFSERAMVDHQDASTFGFPPLVRLVSVTVSFDDSWRRLAQVLQDAAKETAELWGQIGAGLHASYLAIDEWNWTWTPLAQPVPEQVADPLADPLKVAADVDPELYPPTDWGTATAFRRGLVHRTPFAYRWPAIPQQEAPQRPGAAWDRRPRADRRPSAR